MNMEPVAVQNMPQIKPEVETFARIKVLGIGGSGGNAVNHMIDSKVRGIEFLAINTDVQDLHKSLSKKKIHIGKNLTKGLGAGMNPEIGQRAAEETKEEIQEALKGTDMVFIACGMGGGTASGAGHVIAKIAKELGILTIAIVTRPFGFEGIQRNRIAEAAIDNLKQNVDAIIVIPNDRLLSMSSKDTTLKSAFSMSDEVLRQAVEGISDLITTPGVINIDFADIRTIIENAGPALMGIGTASGDKRAEDAAKMAINSPLLEVSINGAKGVLFSIAGGDDLTLFEVQEAAKVITESIDQNAKVIFGTIHSDRIKKGDIQITVIASGFSEIPNKKSLFQNLNTKTEEKESKLGKIFGGTNSVEVKEEKKPEPAIVLEPKEEQKKIEIIEDDDWGAVPSFLRRTKK